MYFVNMFYKNWFLNIISNILYFIQSSIPYIVKFKVTNRAGLAIDEESTPTLYDSSKPTAGKVVDGTDFLNDRVWFSSSKTITGN